MKAVALVIGAILLAAGLAGFVPALSPNGVVFGIFPMDSLKSALFIVTGLVGIGIGMTRSRSLPPTTTSGSDMRDWKQ
jgi:hypothetical protein